MDEKRIEKTNQINSSMTTPRLNEIVSEFDSLIKRWLDFYDWKIDDKGVNESELNSYNFQIEELLVCYMVEIGYDDKVFGVPLSLCLNAPLGFVSFNGENYGSSHNIRTWLKHIAGVELSDQVTASNDDQKLKELALKFWNCCLSKMSEFEFSRLEMIVLEMEMQIENWLFQYDLETDDMEAKKEELDFFNDQIEELFAEYVVEKNYDDKVHGVPLSLCFNAPQGQVKFNGTKYSSSHIFRTWLKHITGVELSDQVSASNDDKELKELALKYWNDCLSKMSNFK